MRTQILTACFALNFPMVVNAATEFICVHTCPPTERREFCDTTFVEDKDDVMFSLTDDVAKAFGQMQDGRLVQTIWKTHSKSADLLVLVSDINDWQAGVQIAAFDLTSNEFAMSGLLLENRNSKKPISYQVVGKCSASMQ